MAAMHDLAPDGPRPEPPETLGSQAHCRRRRTLVSKTAVNIAQYPLRAGSVVIPSALKAVRQLAGLPAKLAGGVASALGPGSGSLFAPTTRFNDSASPHRVFEARFHDLADFQAHQGERARGDDQRRRGGLRRRDAASIPRRPRRVTRGHTRGRLSRVDPGFQREGGGAATGCSADCSRWKRIRRIRTSGWHRSPRNPSAFRDNSDTSNTQPTDGARRPGADHAAGPDGQGGDRDAVLAARRSPTPP